MEHHERALDARLHGGVAQRAGRLRALHEPVAADHEVNVELAREARRAVELALVARAEHARARPHDLADLLGGQPGEVAARAGHVDVHRARAGAARRRRAAAAARAQRAGVDVALVADDVGVGEAAAARAVAVAADRRAHAVLARAEAAAVTRAGAEVARA